MKLVLLTIHLFTYSLVLLPCLVLWPKATNCFSCLPHFAIAEFLQFYFQFFAVIGLAIEVNGTL